MIELWKPIPSLPGYEASDGGRVRSVERMVTDSRGRSYPVAGRVLRLGTSPNGYLRFNTSSGSHTVHVAVLEAFMGPRPDDCQGAHGDGDKANCRLANLRWATKAENAADKKLHGTAYRPIGEAHHGAKLTEEDVRRVKRLHAQCVLQSHIALMTGISRKTINSIVRGKSWRHVQIEQSDRRAMGRVA